MCAPFPNGAVVTANVIVPLFLTSPRAPRRHAASTGREGASKLRNPPPAGWNLPRRPANLMETRNCGKLRYPRLDALEISHQRRQLRGEGVVRRRRRGAPRLASSRFQRDASVDTTAGHIEGRQGSPRVGLSDANCLCSNCLRVIPLEQSSNYRVSENIKILAMKNLL